MKPNLFNLPKEEQYLRDFLDKDKSIAFISSNNPRKKQSFMKAFLCEKLQDGKTFVIRTNKTNVVAQLLEEIGVSNLALSLKKDTHIYRNSITSQVNEDKDYQIEAIKAKISYDKSLEKLNEIKNIYNAPVFGDHPRQKLSELLFLSKKRKNEYRLNLDVSSSNYDFNQNEFWKIRSKIEKAAKFYRAQFSFLRTGDEFKADIYKDYHLAQNKLSVLNTLDGFISATKQLTNKYRNLFQTIRADMVSKLNDQVKLIRKLSEELETQLEFYKIESELATRKRTFGKSKDPIEKQKIALRTHYSMLLEALQEIQLFKINFPENGWIPDTEKLEAFCHTLNEQLKSAHQSIQNKVDEQLEILNANNYNAPELSILSRDQIDLIGAINKSELFKSEIHNLSISAWKNYGFLRKLDKTLTKRRLFLEENSDYAVYRSFEFTLEYKINEIISALEDIENEKWVASFESWYFEALFDKYYLSQIDDLDIRFDLFTQQKFIYENFLGHRIQTVFNGLRYSLSDIQKKIGKDGRDWKSLMIDLNDSFKYSFPIIVCDEEFFSSEIANLNYDFLICIDNDDIPQNIFANSHFESILCFHQNKIDTQIKESAYTSKNYNEKGQFQLKSKEIPTDMKIGQNLKFSIELSKSLTYTLKESRYEKQFYSAKDFSIISCVSDFCSKLIEIEFLDIRIKSLKYTHLESGIVDDIIMKDDRNKYLIVQDSFLDPSLDIEWQISVLRKIEQAGIKIININTAQLAQSADASIITLMEIPELKQMAVRSEKVV
ncbi:hypothetical protein [Portibacter lacus]|uniref:Uncharacterized protein n=1 Tax=Portibacter lacus TaxID=1099794 RepID=A0AA37SUA7_9BACT|nr:hypothetical protein [Portibacter lacus]GLR18363.1 hypothetical protein GCM10007940_29790 [Portibacter lacus]